MEYLKHKVLLFLVEQIFLIGPTTVSFYVFSMFTNIFTMIQCFYWSHICFFWSSFVLYVYNHSTLKQKMMTMISWKEYYYWLNTFQMAPLKLFVSNFVFCISTISSSFLSIDVELLTSPWMTNQSWREWRTVLTFPRFEPPTS